jgi:transposase
MNKPPTLAQKKEAIQEWLQRNNINYEEEMTKTELLQLVRIQRPPPEYVIDSTFQEHGHETIRLPPYNCDLNAIEFIWNIIRTKVAHKNVGQSAADIQNLITQVIENINVEDWKSAISNVKKIEADCWTRDHLLEEEIEHVVIKFGGEDTNTDSSNDSHSSISD